MRTGGKPKNLKQNNSRVILDLLRKRDTVSVAEISDLIGLSKTTVKKIIDNLVIRKIALSKGKGESTGEGGKKPEIFSFNNNYGYVLSLHITPDSIISVITDLQANITYYSMSVVNSDHSLEAMINRLGVIIRSLSGMMEANGGKKLIGIAVALPGLVDSAAGVSIYSPHYHSWGRNAPFLALLQENLTDSDRVPILIGNVNRLQAIAEKEKGIAKGIDNFLIIDALEQGLGAGIIIHGDFMQGIKSLSGEIGHMTLDPWGGPLCSCGNRGCFEALVAAKRIVALAREAYPGHRDSMLFQDGIDSAALTLASVCENAALGDALSLELVGDAANWFAVGISNIIMVNDPELIVLQGIYVKAGDFFLERLWERLRELGLPDVEKRVRIEYSRLGEERGVIGGAALVINNFFERQLVY